MKKFLFIMIICSIFTFQLIRSCTPCTQAAQFHDRFHFVKSYNHGAPVESVSSLCDCNGVKYVGIAGFASFDCTEGIKRSIRMYYIDVAAGNALIEMSIDKPSPSDYLFSIEMCCLQQDSYQVPYFVVAGYPDADGNVVWVYKFDGTQFVQVAQWGKDGYPQPLMQYCATINCVPYTFGGAFYDIAVVGKAYGATDAEKVAYVYILKYIPDNSLTQYDVVPFEGGDLFKAAWLNASRGTNFCTCNVPCPYLAVGGSDRFVCSSGTRAVIKIDGKVYPSTQTGQISTIPPIIIGAECTVRQLVWKCCDKYPYPFLLVTADEPSSTDPYGYESKIDVFYLDPQTQTLNLLAQHILPGKIFAGQFTPGCDCKSVTVGGGCFDMSQPCTTNIWTLSYDCPPDGKYPIIPMTESKKAQTSFGDVVTSLVFCPEVDVNGERLCETMIVTSESNNYLSPLDPLCPQQQQKKGEIGVYKVFFCKKTASSCMPTPICQRTPEQTELSK